MRDVGQALWAQVAGRDLFIRSSDLVEVAPFERLEPVPFAMPGLAGILPLRSGPLPVLDWKLFQTPASSTGLMAVLRRRLGLPVERVLEVRDLAGSSILGLKAGDPWNAVLSHRCRLAGRSYGVLEVEKLLALLHNRNFRH